MSELTNNTVFRIKQETLIDRKIIQSLIGICSGLIADAELNDTEIKFLRAWLLEHNSAISKWPGNIIHHRLNQIFKDNVITETERKSLINTLESICGNDFIETGDALIKTTAEPIDDDPSIFFRDMVYCFTGEFLFGSRANCERAVLNLGAMTIDTVNQKINYLVIGSKTSKHWANTSYGRKIEKAMKLNNEGFDITIISEVQWVNAMSEYK